MERFDRQPFGVEKGSVALFSDFDTGGAMWTGEGPRVVRRGVTFSTPFRAAPTVFVAPEMWDYDSTANIRGDLGTEAVGPEGFEVVFQVWADTRVARLRVVWMAIGPLGHEDDWEL